MLNSVKIILIKCKNDGNYYIYIYIYANFLTHFIQQFIKLIN